MAESVLQLDPRDNVLVALTTLAAGTVALFRSCPHPVEDIPAKHRWPWLTSRRATWCLCTAWWWEKPPRPFHAAVCSLRGNVRHRAGAYSATRQPVAHALCPMPPALTNAYLQGFSPSRRPGGHPQLLAGAAAGLLRKPQRGADERGP